MPELSWAAFGKLPGSPNKNFELLCRSVVRYNFGSYGVLRALANQPGVEFHLKLDQSCTTLGGPGRWWGWQCKWYDLPASGALGKTRREQIEEGIRKTEVHVAGVTDWVLWTRRPLGRADQMWFDSICSRMTLHLWTGDDIDGLLVGQATILRSTYFGELVLTPDILLERHTESVAPIRARWQPDVHQVLDAERELRRMLGESGSWAAICDLAVYLRAQQQAVEIAPMPPSTLARFVSAVVKSTNEFAATLERVADGIRDGDIDLLRDELLMRVHTLRPDVSMAPRRLRSGNYLVSLHVTNAVWGCREALRLLDEVESAFASRLVAVLAPAGCGKTQLAAQLTAGTDTRPCGMLLHGRDLHANHTLDDLARRITIAGQPIQSMELLLAAIDAAGQRAGHRLPLAIDGLNESEDPRTWKRLLAELEAILTKYPYVLVVCTLRPEFRAEALPDRTRGVAIEGYGDETIDAIRKHFQYYKIDATDASLPIGLLRNPLTLRLFCEVTNPTRSKMVGLAATPGSLTDLFDRYLDQVGTRIADLTPRNHRYYPQDVRAALAAIGDILWDTRSRSIDVNDLRRTLKDEQRPWDQSLVRALEQEGILLRMPSSGNDVYQPVYDRLGGHIIANALLARYGRDSFEAWIRESSNTTLLVGNYDIRHPLADDIIYSLVGQIPRRFHARQLWQMVDDPLRTNALRTVAGIEATYLDAATVDALLDLIHHGDTELLERLREVRGIERHPLNASALDRVLRPMGVADRDLLWTEWVRRNHDNLLRDLERLERRWRKQVVRPGDPLRARWVMWLLTSTARQLRDQATRTLYWFGRNNPDAFFEMTIDALDTNDTYISERMLAASYGVVMSHQQPPANIEPSLTPFLHKLENALVGFSATAATTHYLVRLYVRGMVEFAARFCVSAIPESMRGDWTFAAPAPVLPLPKGDARAKEVESTLQIDFRNYTLGGFFNARHNYDMDHPGHQAAVAHINGVVWELGWRAKRFDKLDRIIAEGKFRSEVRGHSPRTERYGKKYGWIGFFTYAGMLESQHLLPDGSQRLSDVDIDPSFPEKTRSDGDENLASAWLQREVESDERWLREATTTLPRQVLVREKIADHQGPWIAVHGLIRTADKILGREAWGFLSALVTSKKSLPVVLATLKSGEQPWVARDAPSNHYTFAGEIPWHQSFAAESQADSDPARIYRERVRANGDCAEVEVLAHNYAWESYHSELNRAGLSRVPSRCFSERFDLRSMPQGFDQCLPDGTRVTITLSGVDGFDGDILYVREDLFRQYVGGRTFVWFGFGERELYRFPSSPPKWLTDIYQRQENAWRVVLTDADLTPQKATRPKTVVPKKKRSAKGKS